MSASGRAARTGSFAAFVGARADLDTLLEPILRRLYAVAEQRSCAQLYVLSIVALTFSHDAGFCDDAFARVTLPAPPAWYRERVLRGVNLGSLCVLCALRCVVFSVRALRDGYLASNVFAILLNLSPHARDVHEYARLRCRGRRG